MNQKAYFVRLTDFNILIKMILLHKFIIKVESKEKIKSKNNFSSSIWDDKSNNVADRG